MPSKSIRFSEARSVLHNLEDHSRKEIDAAFEALIYSLDPSDRKLCEEAVNYMWDAPKANYPVVMVIAAFLTVVMITLSVMLVEVLL